MKKRMRWWYVPGVMLCAWALSSLIYAAQSHRTNRLELLILTNALRQVDYRNIRSRADLDAVVAEFPVQIPGNPYHAFVAYTNSMAWTVTLRPQLKRTYQKHLGGVERFVVMDFKKMDYPEIVIRGRQREHNIAVDVTASR